MKSRPPSRTDAVSRRAALAVAAVAGGFIFSTILGSTHVLAAEFPSQRVRFIVPVAAGGSTDMQARTLAQHLGEIWKQPVVVENHPGAGSTIGGNLVAKAPADGYTLLFGGDTLVINEALGRKLPFDLRKDFASVTQTIAAAQILVIRPDLPAKTLREFLELARTTKGGLNLATPGSGSPGHLATELLQARTGVKFNLAHYKGGGPATVDVLGGHVDGVFITLPAVITHVQNGTLRPLAVSTAKRAGAVPDVPTVEESGIANFQITSWQGVLAPAGTPKEVVKKLRDGFVAALAKPEVRDLLTGQGFDVVGNTPEELAALIKDTIPRWKEIVAVAGNIEQ